MHTRLLPALLPTLCYGLLLVAPAPLWARAPESPTSPLDLRSSARGVDAASHDPAATALVDGPELQYRQQLSLQGAVNPQMGVFGVLPAGPAALTAGYEWLRTLGDGQAFERGTLGLSGRLGRRLALGLAWRGFRSRKAELSGTAWDASIFSEATHWLSFSAGVQGFNSPMFAGRRRAPAYALGASVRPVLGMPWITLGFEGRFSRDPVQERYELSLGHALVDLAPVEGVHALLGYENRDGVDGVWAGLSVSLEGVQATGLVLAADGKAANANVALTVRANPAESLTRQGGKRIRVVLVGDLTSSPSSLWAAPEAVPAIPLKLAALADDPTVDEVHLAVGRLEVGMATVDTLRATIKHLRDSGKRVVATIAGADDKTYLVAAACDEIRMDPSSTLYVDGFAVSIKYFAEGLSNIGVKFHSVEIGDYKSGPDPLTRTRARPEDREVREALLEGAWGVLMSALRDDRGLTEAEVAHVLERGIFSAAAAKSAGLVDAFTAPLDPEAAPEANVSTEPIRDNARPSRMWGQSPVIAIIPVVGTIVLRAGDNVLPGKSAAAQQIIPWIEAAMNDSDVAAVVLRVDTPGGDVLASDLIWRAVRRLRERKPVVVSMGDVAASGGYYVAAPADAIFAQPNTITGSIGIFTVKVETAGLYEKLGIHSEVFEAGDRAAWNLPERGLSDDDRARIRNNLQAHYDAFVAKVAAGRKMPMKQARTIAGGRVYNGAKALELGLVDRMGGLGDAIAEAKKRAGLGSDIDVQVAVSSERASMNAVLGNLTGASQSVLDAASAEIARFEGLNGMVFALMPIRYDISR